MDETPDLEHGLASWYQYLIGIIRWMAEIGRLDIITEVSMMASHMAMPREGQLESVLHVFAFLRQRYNSRMAFDPTYPIINMNDFKKCKWKDFYWDLKEATPPNSPEERGKEVDICGYVDINHEEENKTRSSRSGFFIFLNTAMIQWLSKKQAKI